MTSLEWASPDCVSVMYTPNNVYESVDISVPEKKQ